MDYAWLFLVVTIFQGEDIRDMKIKTIQATDLASCEELRVEQRQILKLRAKTEDGLVWHVGECLTESPFSHHHNNYR